MRRRYCHRPDHAALATTRLAAQPNAAISCTPTVVSAQTGGNTHLLFDRPELIHGKTLGEDMPNSATRNRLTAIGIAAAAMSAAALLAPAQASAAVPSTENITCTQGWFCMYAPGENPPHGEFSVGVYDLGGWNGGVLNDNVNWFWNLTGVNWCVYTDAGYDGASQVVSPGYSGNLNNFGYQVSSAEAC